MDYSNSTTFDNLPLYIKQARLILENQAKTYTNGEQVTLFLSSPLKKEIEYKIEVKTLECSHHVGTIEPKVSKVCCGDVNLDEIKFVPYTSLSEHPDEPISNRVVDHILLNGYIVVVSKDNSKYELAIYGPDEYTETKITMKDIETLYDAYNPEILLINRCEGADISDLVVHFRCIKCLVETFDSLFSFNLTHVRHLTLIYNFDPKRLYNFKDLNLSEGVKIDVVISPGCITDDVISLLKELKHIYKRVTVDYIDTGGCKCRNQDGLISTEFYLADSYEICIHSTKFFVL